MSTSDNKPKRARAETKAIRVSILAYADLMRSKELYAQLNHIRRYTISNFIRELCNVANLMLNGKEVYISGDKLFSDKSEAWGHFAMIMAKYDKELTKASKPKIALVLGEDDSVKVK